nr:MAG TPA: hypothetical protein [Caudoviricetes sp.]
MAAFLLAASSPFSPDGSLPPHPLYSLTPYNPPSPLFRYKHQKTLVFILSRDFVSPRARMCAHVLTHAHTHTRHTSQREHVCTTPRAPIRA